MRTEILNILKIFLVLLSVLQSRMAVGYDANPTKEGIAGPRVR